MTRIEAIRYIDNFLRILHLDPNRLLRFQLN